MLGAFCAAAEHLAFIISYGLAWVSFALFLGDRL